MKVLTSLFGPRQSALEALNQGLGTSAATVTNRQFFEMLKAYYLNNGLYESLDELLGSAGIEIAKIRSIRNPAFRVVEFYAATIWPGTLPSALPIETENETIIDLIHQIWTWSNWSIQKQNAARWFAMYGVTYIRISQVSDDNGDPTSVYLQLIEPQNVVEESLDQRGFLTYLHLEVPTVNEKGQAGFYTEIWDKEAGTLTVWQFCIRPREGLFETFYLMDEWGIDFIPIVRQTFKAVDRYEPISAFLLQIEKIDELNRQATRLSQMLYRHNRALWALKSNMTDNLGRPLPPPRLPENILGEPRLDITDKDDTIVQLPGMASLESLIPPIDYGSALAVLDSQLHEIEQDLPELVFFRLRELGAPSGVAIRLLLQDVEARLTEVRGNIESALIQAHQMALTIGQNLGLFPTTIGTYETGAFEHEFIPRPFIPRSLEEIADLLAKLVASGIPLLFAAKLIGFTQDEILELSDALDSEALRQQSALAQTLLGAAQQANDLEDTDAPDVQVPSSN